MRFSVSFNYKAHLQLLYKYSSKPHTPKRNSHSPYSETLFFNKSSGLPEVCHVKTIKSLPSGKLPAQLLVSKLQVVSKLTNKSRVGFLGGWGGLKRNELKLSM